MQPSVHWDRWETHLQRQWRWIRIRRDLKIVSPVPGLRQLLESCLPPNTVTIVYSV